MRTTVRQKFPIYYVKLLSTDGKKELVVSLTMLDKPVITTQSNARIRKLKKLPRLRGLCLDSEDEREKHPLYLILGVGDISRIINLLQRRQSLVGR